MKTLILNTRNIAANFSAEQLEAHTREERAFATESARRGDALWEKIHTAVADELEAAIALQKDPAGLVGATNFHNKYPLTMMMQTIALYARHEIEALAA